MIGAFVVPVHKDRAATGKSSPESLGAELSRWTGERLPVQMVPKVWRFVDSLPLTANGKVDRKALATFAGSLAPEESGVEEVPPRTPLETFLHALWQEVLALPVPGVRANFFRLGGDSLKAVRILTRLGEKLSLSLPLRDFFTTPTIEGLAGHIVERISAGMRNDKQENA